MRFRTLGAAAMLTVAAAFAAPAQAGDPAAVRITYLRGGDLPDRAAVEALAPPALPAGQRVLLVERSVRPMDPARYLVNDLVLTATHASSRVTVVDVRRGTAEPGPQATTQRRGHGRNVCVTGQTIPNPAFESCLRTAAELDVHATYACWKLPPEACYAAKKLAAEARVVCYQMAPYVTTADACQYVQVPHSGNPVADEFVDETIEHADEEYCKRPCEIG